MKFEILKPQSFCVAGKDKVLEDSTFPDAGAGTVHDRLFVVADGMGGEGKGDVASASLCRSIPEFLFQNTCSDEPFTDDLMHLTMLDAYKQLSQDCANGGGVMFAMVYFHRQGVMAAHVGNCRIYQFRPKTNTLLYKSRDDFKAATPDMVQPIEPTCRNLTNVKYGDYFVLLTKGAHAAIHEEQLFDVLADNINDEAKLRRIRQLIGETKEDTTVSIVRVSGVMAEAIDEHVSREPQPEPVVVPKAPKKPQAQPLQKPQPQQKPQSQQKPQPQQPVRPVAEPSHGEAARGTATNVETEEHEKKGGFPVVPVTALVLVALAIGFYLWSKSQFTAAEEEEETVVVKKDTVRKDTINIMRNETAKSKVDDDLFKLPEEEKKKAEEEKRKAEEEKRKAESEKVADVDPDASSPSDNTNALDVPPAPTTSASSATSATPATPASSATPASATSPAPATTKPAGPPADNPAPSTVVPRPVIPEE